MMSKDYKVRADAAFNAAVVAWGKGDIETYDRNRGILNEMVRDKCVNSEYLRDLNGMINY